MSDLGTPTLATPKESCVCSALHYSCDPAECEEASARSSVSFGLPIYFDGYKLVNAANSGCSTCQTMLMGLNIFRGYSPEDYRVDIKDEWVVDVYREAGTIMKLTGGKIGFEFMQSSPTSKCLSSLK
jgi:hypothetical protein